MQNPSKILGHKWDKEIDSIEIQIPKQAEDEAITKRSILSTLGSIYDPLGLMSPTLAEGKHIYREACEESGQWNKEVSPSVKKDWIKWTSQLRNVKVPRSLIKDIKKVKTLMDYHRINRTEAVVPEIGEIVLIVGEEKNRGQWMKGKVLQHVTGRDGVIRGAIVLHKGNHLERPLQLLCPLEIRSEIVEEAPVVQSKDEVHSKGSRVAARNAEIRTKLILDDE